MKQNKRHSKRFNVALAEQRIIDQANNRFLKKHQKKHKEIGDGILFVSHDGVKATVIVDGKEKNLKLNETKKGLFVRVNNKSYYI